ncbi:MAG: hypothetical protein AAGF11_32880 [Myxococcota bacterium]
MKASPTALSTLVLLGSCSLHDPSRATEVRMHPPKLATRAEAGAPAHTTGEPSNPDRSRRPVRRPSRVLRNLYFFRG